MTEEFSNSSSLIGKSFLQAPERIILAGEDDLNFVESSIKCSSEEILLCFNQFSDDLEGITGEAELMEGVTDELVGALSGQCEAVTALKYQFVEFLNRTSYVQSFAATKQAELDDMKKTQKAYEKELMGAYSKMTILEVSQRSRLVRYLLSF